MEAWYRPQSGTTDYEILLILDSSVGANWALGGENHFLNIGTNLKNPLCESVNRCPVGSTIFFLR
jgi:hypothetical protein